MIAGQRFAWLESDLGQAHLRSELLPQVLRSQLSSPLVTETEDNCLNVL